MNNANTDNQQPRRQVNGNPKPFNPKGKKPGYKKRPAVKKGPSFKAKTEEGKVIRLSMPVDKQGLHSLLEKLHNGQYKFNAVRLIRGYWMNRHKGMKDMLPLSVGVHNELLKDAVREDGSHQDIFLFRAALTLHVTSPAYLVNTMQKKRRFNLDGSDSERLNREAKLYAAKQFLDALNAIKEQPKRFRAIPLKQIQAYENFCKNAGIEAYPAAQEEQED